MSGDVEQADYGRADPGSAATINQLFRPHQLILAGSPTHADDDAQMQLNKSDSVSAAELAHVDRHGGGVVRGADDVRTRSTDDSGICDVVWWLLTVTGSGNSLSNCVYCATSLCYRRRRWPMRE